MKSQDIRAQLSLGEGRKAVERLQLVVKTGGAVKKWSKQMKNSRQRIYILKEWISTEKAYIQDLKRIQGSIQKPLKEAKLINSEQQRILFPNIKSMIELSQNLLLCVQAAVFGWNPHSTLIGENLKAYYKFFMIYREYCNNFMKGQKIIKHLKTIPEAIRIQEKLKLDFESYVIKPVQRPPKYQLLLREYLKALPKEHKDYKAINQAISKYHQVNELNNQSMDRQIRVQAMIKLQKLYGGIIQSKSGRQYLREFACNWSQQSCELHIFNDMVLLLRKENEKAPRLAKKLLLDYTSFVHCKRHLKYCKNLVFVCGSTQSLHLEFATAADSQLFAEYLCAQIVKLRQRQEDKRYRYSQNQTRKKNINKFKVSKWHEDLYFRVIYNPKLEITIDDTLKPSSDPLFYVRFRVIQPYHLNQVVLVNRQVMQGIQKMIKQAYPNISIPKLSQNAESMGFYDAVKNRTKIIEYRSFVYEEFLNYVFRNQQFHDSWKSIARRLSINESLFDFASSQNFSCKCNLCLETKEDQSFQYYVKKINDLKKGKRIVKSRLIWSTEVNNTARQTFLNAEGDYILFKDICSANYFHILQKISKKPLKPQSNYFQKMLALEASLGKINYSLIQADQPKSTKNQTSLRIYILSAQQQYVEISLKEDRYIRDIVEQIGAKNSLENVFDWGIFLVLNQDVIQIPEDEKLLSFIAKWKVEVSKNEGEHSEDSDLVVKKLNGVQSLTQFLFGSQKGVLLFKKSMYFQPSLQIQWCLSNKQRYNFLIGQLYGRLKLSDLRLSYVLIVQMCSFYLLQKDIQKIKYYSFEHFNTERLKSILPKNYDPIIADPNFKAELYRKIIANHEEISRLPSQRNAIQIIYFKILEKIRTSPEWVTRNFYLTTYKSPQKYDVIVKISTKNLAVVKNMTMQKLFEVDLRYLKYKVTTFSLFIQIYDQEYRFDGLQVLDVKWLVQNYLAYRNLTELEQ